MKKSFFLLPILLIGSTLSGFSEESKNTFLSENLPVLIIQDKSDDPDAPRTQSFNPFIAELLDGSNSVLLGSTDNVGTVAVQIISMAGDNYSTYFNTSVGTILLHISGNAGYYILTIITPDGTHYVGEFTI